MRAFAAAFGLTLVLAGAVSAQSITVGKGAVLRGLDKIGGRVRDIELHSGGSTMLGRIRITLGECRYPSGNPSGDAYAYVAIQEEGRESPHFIGWMIASSPALSALDHPRYDVWVLRCMTK
ncbi:MAG: hypothetical protein CSA70_07615 [Rhodobacterales bacterium]|nr:MAG: hypothetical protein CSA70_07615 [Rhodobacterales bacterium]